MTLTDQDILDLATKATAWRDDLTPRIEGGPYPLTAKADCIRFVDEVLDPEARRLWKQRNELRNQLGRLRAQIRKLGAEPMT